MSMSDSATLVVILATVGVTVLGTLLAQNLSSGERKVDYRIDHLHAPDQPVFERSMGHLLGPPLVAGNRVTSLLNGDQIFPANARRDPAAPQDDHLRDLHLLVGHDRDASSPMRLAERATRRRQGPRAAGLGRQREDGRAHAARSMKEAGVEVEKYHPLRWYNLRGINNRTHRKLLVVDGRVGFTGGVGIADEWLGQCPGPPSTGATRISGSKAPPSRRCRPPSWTTGSRPTREVLHGEDYFPAARRRRATRSAQVFRSSPRGRQRERAADVPAVDRGGRDGASGSPAPTSCRTTCPSQTLVDAREARRAGRDHRAGPDTSTRQIVAPGLPVALGRRCWRRASRSTSTSRRCTTAKS